MIELVGVSGANIWFIRSGMCQSPDTVNCLTLGKSFNPGQVEAPHLWREEIVLCLVAFDLLNLLAFEIDLVETYNSHPPFCQCKKIHSYLPTTSVNFWSEHTYFSLISNMTLNRSSKYFFPVFFPGMAFKGFAHGKAKLKLQSASSDSNVSHASNHKRLKLPSSGLMSQIGKSSHMGKSQPSCVWVNSKFRF